MRKCIVCIFIILIFSCSRPLINTVNIDDIVEKVENKFYLNESIKTSLNEQEKLKYNVLKVNKKSITAFDSDDFGICSDNIMFSDTNKIFYLVGNNGKRFCVNNNEKILYGYYKNIRKQIYILADIKTFTRNVLSDVQIEDELVYSNRINRELIEYDYVHELGFKTDIINNIGYISERKFACYKKNEATVFEIHFFEK